MSSIWDEFLEAAEGAYESVADNVGSWIDGQFDNNNAQQSAPPAQQQPPAAQPTTPMATGTIIPGVEDKFTFAGAAILLVLLIKK